jgi:hypothetical protein
MILALILFIYVLGVVVFTGMSFAFWQRNWPRFGMPAQGFAQDRMRSLAFWLLPIVGWAVVLFGSKFAHHGWLWPWSAKAKEEAGIVK